jgi:hypothetical protein
MPYFEFLWTDEIIDHLAEHGIGTKEFELGRNCGRTAVVLRV